MFSSMQNADQKNQRKYNKCACAYTVNADYPLGAAPTGVYNNTQNHMGYKNTVNAR